MPASKKQVKNESRKIQKGIKKINNSCEQVMANVTKLNENVIQLKTDNEQLKADSECLKEDHKQRQAENQQLKRQINDLGIQINSMDTKIISMDTEIIRHSKELVWSQVFHDTIKESEWLVNKTFSPGRWAAGYPFLYILYRVLDELKPQSILEMGLGQTTRVIGQYAKKYDECEHLVLEHDETWIEFSEQSFKLAPNSQIMKMAIGKEQYLDDDEVLMYLGIEELKGKKFDLVVVDAPFGGMAKKYSRVDILKLIPECLNENFVILLDDYNRPGEKETAKLLISKLDEANINYKTGCYSGDKDTYIVTSENVGFLCSL